MTTAKIWGTTAVLIHTPMFEMHKLNIRPRHRCSTHLHRYKWNAFVVLEGTLFIDTFSVDDDPHLLRVGPTFTVGTDGVRAIGPGVWHQFRTGELPCIALEMYYPERMSDDIIRRNIGGPA